MLGLILGQNYNRTPREVRPRSHTVHNFLSRDVVPSRTESRAMSESAKPCPTCSSPYGYFDGTAWNCPECGGVWPEEAAEEVQEADDVVRDALGHILQNGDDVVVIKDLPVKGAPKPVKAGTKVKNIRLVEGDHNIACRVEGFGAMGLKSEFVKKA